jgi:hypothetical protein
MVFLENKRVVIFSLFQFWSLYFQSF